MKTFARFPSEPVRIALCTLAMALPLVVSAADSQSFNSVHDTDSFRSGAPTLVSKVYDANKKYLNINTALNELPEHWVRATPCVSGPNEGAMGVHLIKPSRVGDGELKPEEPEALIYEPLPGGRFRLVGVEFIVIAQDWALKHPDGTPPSVDGHLANYVGSPNRYGLPAFYELHVWAFERNPKGSFADWNTSVTCERQATE